MILTFLGGLAAASGIIIVITLAMAAMLLNHLVLPFHKPSPRHDFYRWLLWMRRSLIAAILLLAYGFYALVGADLDLNRLGLLAFVAAVQFLPGVLGFAVLAPKPNRHGFLLGLISGIAVWIYGMLLPFSELALGWNVPLPLPNVDESNWHLAAMGALAVNLTLFVLSQLTGQTQTVGNFGGPGLLH